MTTLSELYFLNSGWGMNTIISVSHNSNFYKFKGKELPNCEFSNYIVAGFWDDLVVVKENSND